MNRKVKITVGRLISPLVICILKIYTTITGTQRARIAVLSEDGQILLVRGIIGTEWSLPGGGIEKGESPAEAAVRELYEETGMRVGVDQAHALAVLKGKKSPVGYTAHLFSVSVQRRMLPAKQFNTHEIIELGWFPLDELPANISAIVAPCVEFLPKYR